MSTEEEIRYMKIRLIRLASEEWHLTIEEAADLFAKNEVMVNFIHSSTGKLLYDPKSKLWWCGPSDIAEMYKKELLSAK